MGSPARRPPPSPNPSRIVSSDHLVSERAPEMSEFEYGLIVAGHAFDRWVVRCMKATGLAELSRLDVLVLHSVNHRNREKRLPDLCFVLNVEDTHTVVYALKKLEKLGLVQRRKAGKEAFFTTTEAGAEACARYREVRETCLVEAFQSLGLDPARLGDMAESLRALSGLYDQAARSATSL